jgi:hypothetical protein
MGYGGEEGKTIDLHHDRNNVHKAVRKQQPLRRQFGECEATSVPSPVTFRVLGEQKGGGMVKGNKYAQGVGTIR